MKTVIRYMLIFTTASACAVSQGNPIINEIMYAPEQGKCEWIELYNPCGDTIDLNGWIIHDATTARNPVATAHFALQPGAYAVACADSTLISDFPEMASRMTVMKGFPSLNNSGDELFLLDPDLKLRDYIHYRSSWGGGSGVSLERIDPNGESNLKENWKTGIAAEKATPGRKNSVSKPDHDLAIDAVRIDPARPRMGETARIEIQARNGGTADAAGFGLKVYEPSVDGDSTTPGLPILTLSSTAVLAASETAVLSGILYPTDMPQRNLSAVIACENDEDARNDTGRIGFRYSPAAGSVVINEIMYAPLSGDPEWIELYNATARSVNAAGWFICDEASSREIDAGSGATIPPYGFCVLSASEDILRRYPSMPVTPIILALPSLNNGGDAVRLLDDAGAAVDSMRYESAWGGGDGLSLERVNFTRPSSYAANWKPCEDLSGGTPGAPNSVRARDRNLAIGTVLIMGADAAVTVLNAGLLASAAGMLFLYHDRDGDGSPSPLEEIARAEIPTLESGDSCVLRFNETTDATGIIRLIFRIEYDADERPGDNIRSVEMVRAAEPGLFAINEIMYAPFSGEAEWVEYINRSPAAVDIAGYKLARDKSTDGTRTTIQLPVTPTPVLPGDYVVIASDSALFARFKYLLEGGSTSRVVILNRVSLGLTENGELLLCDPAGTVIDSMMYSPSLHNPNVHDTRGRSLERLNPEFPPMLRSNWSTCPETEGGTPGKRNALFTGRPPWESGGKARLLATPNPFSPDGDGHDDHCVISWELPGSVSQIRLRIFDSIGRQVRTVASNQPSGRAGQLLFDGNDDGGRRLPIGVYIMLLEAVDFHGAGISSIKEALVIATRL